jgi:hypothetical protein
MLASGDAPGTRGNSGPVAGTPVVVPAATPAVAVGPPRSSRPNARAGLGRGRNNTGTGLGDPQGQSPVPVTTGRVRFASTLAPGRLVLVAAPIFGKIAHSCCTVGASRVCVRLPGVEAIARPQRKNSHPKACLGTARLMLRHSPEDSKWQGAF